MTGAEGWGEPDPGPDVRPHPDPIDGPVRVIDRRGDWVRIETPSRDRYWVTANTLDPPPMPPVAPGGIPPPA